MARAMANASETEYKRRKVYNFDYTLLFMVIFFVGFGFVMVYSTSAYSATLKRGDGIFYLKKQAFASVLGFAALAFLSNVDYMVWKRFIRPLYMLAFVLCLIVNFTGSNLNGSSRWLNIAGISVQPSEIAKIAVIFLMAKLISEAPKKMKDIKNCLIACVYVLPIFIVVAVNNLSTAIIILGICFIMIFVCNPGYIQFIGLIIGAVALGIIFILTAGYRANRVRYWLHPEEGNPDDVYQTMQGLYAIGSGGLFGKGLGESVQKNFVPEATNDMIFSIICEELGIFGAVCVILMYILLLYRLIYIANHARDMFGSYLAIGIMAHIAIQVVLNIAVVTNSMPNTGVTLPFISYGGTSLAILIAEVGIALSVSKYMDFDDNYEDV